MTYWCFSSRWESCRGDQAVGIDTGVRDEGQSGSSIGTVVGSINHASVPVGPTSGLLEDSARRTLYLGLAVEGHLVVDQVLNE